MTSNLLFSLVNNTDLQNLLERLQFRPNGDQLVHREFLHSNPALYERLNSKSIVDGYETLVTFVDRKTGAVSFELNRKPLDVGLPSNIIEEDGTINTSLIPFLVNDDTGYGINKAKVLSVLEYIRDAYTDMFPVKLVDERKLCRWGSYAHAMFFTGPEESTGYLSVLTPCLEEVTINATYVACGRTVRLNMQSGQHLSFQSYELTTYLLREFKNQFEDYISFSIKTDKHANSSNN